MKIKRNENSYLVLYDMYRNEPYKERSTLVIMPAKTIAEVEILAYLVGFKCISIGRDPSRVIVPPENTRERPLRIRVFNQHVMGIWITEGGSFHPPRDVYEQLDKVYKSTVDELEIYNLPCDYLMLVLHWASKHPFRRIHFIGQEIQWPHYATIRNLYTPVLVFVLCAAHLHKLLSGCRKKVFVWCGYPIGHLQHLPLDLRFYTPEHNPKETSWVCFPEMFHDVFIDIPKSEEVFKPIA